MPQRVVQEILNMSPRANVQYFLYNPRRHVITDLQQVTSPISMVSPW